MGISDDEIERLDRESGRTLTILRRRLAQSEAIRSPDWSSEEELALALAPMMLAGAWITNQEADQYLMRELAGCEEFGHLERVFTRLLNLEDSPVWSVGGFHGVASKVDAPLRHASLDRHRPNKALPRSGGDRVVRARTQRLIYLRTSNWQLPCTGRPERFSSTLKKRRRGKPCAAGDSRQCAFS